ncbi:MAG: trypsin-like peptidase domain-containing protein [Armatimonadota bacterium]|nr:trypsin-like peptidase domain-containing protein [Armatimonadota bacterium]
MLLAVLVTGGLLGGVVAPRYGLTLAPATIGTVGVPQGAPPGAPSASAPSAAVPPVVAGPRVVEREESAVIRVVQEVRPAVVNINVRAQVATPFGLYPQEGQGSGVIVRSDGLILTNNHVVQGAQEITVTLLSGRTLRGRVLGADRFADMAVVKVESPQPLPVAEMGVSSTLQVGQLAIAIGNPFGLGSTVTVGVVSALNRSIQASPDFVVENLIQTDAAINPGNSGGALLDSSGRLIGINTAIIRDAQGIGFAIPIDHARAVMDQLVAQGRVVRPALGVEIRGEIDANTARAYRLPVDHGVVVVPQQGSPAERAGMRPQDIIVAIDGQKINTIGDLRRELFRKKPGDSVRVEVVRDGRRLTLTVTLTELRSGIPTWVVA